MILGGGNNSNMMQDSANNKTMSADLDDLNRTLYDIGAQDLLDVWEAMEAQVRNWKVLSEKIKRKETLKIHGKGCRTKLVTDN